MAALQFGAFSWKTFQVLNDTLPKATGTAERLRRRNAGPNPHLPAGARQRLFPQVTASRQKLTSIRQSRTVLTVYTVVETPRACA
jgi:hypothetical protein